MKSDGHRATPALKVSRFCSSAYGHSFCTGKRRDGFGPTGQTKWSRCQCACHGRKS